MTLKEGVIMQFFNILSKSSGFKVLFICVFLDTIFGVLRAIKEKKVNSNVGIDGLIRKFGMMISCLFFLLIDLIMEINLLSFVPKEVLSFFKLESVGISTLFVYLFILYESLSILKNMIKCKLPIPKAFQRALEKIFKTFTAELDEGIEKNDKNNKSNK